MRQIQHKNDWYYEFRPFLIGVFGFVGLFVSFSSMSPIWALICRVCSLALLITAYKINQWRRHYRTPRRY